MNVNLTKSTAFGDPNQILVSPREVLESKLKNPRRILSCNESIEVISECITRGEEASFQALGKELIAVIGPAGGGKSTLINYLNGCEMAYASGEEAGIGQRSRKVVTVKPTSSIKELTAVRHSDQFKSFIPKIVDINANISFCDCSGFFDVSGFEINSANAVNICKTLQRSKRVKFILLIDYLSLDVDRGKAFTDLLTFCTKFFGSKENFKKCLDSILLGISKVSRKPDGEDSLELNLLKKNIFAHGTNDQIESEIRKSLSERLFIYHPLNFNDLYYQGASTRHEILKLFHALPSIEITPGIFRTVLTHEDEKGFSQIHEGIKKDIERKLLNHDVTEKELKSVADDYNRFKKLDAIENVHILELIRSIRNTIVGFFKEKLMQFDLCCSKGTDEHQKEAAILIDQIAHGLGIFDSEIQAAIDFADKQAQCRAFGSKRDAQDAAKRMQEIQKLFYEQCLKNNVQEAELLLNAILGQLESYYAKFHASGIDPGIDIEKIKADFLNFYHQRMQEKKVDQSQKDALARMEKEKRGVELSLEEQRQVVLDLQKQNERQASFTRKVEKALAKTEKKLEESKEQEMALIRERERQQQRVRTVESAMKNNKVEEVDRAFAEGAKVTTQTLTWACMTRNQAIIEAVIKMGGKPDEETLTAACSTNQVIIVKSVLHIGAQPNFRTLAVAEATKNESIVKMVKDSIISVYMKLKSGKV